jgi:hypothetical protein
MTIHTDIPSIFRDKKVPGSEEAIMMNDLEQHHVCCNRKRAFINNMESNYGMLRLKTDNEELELPATLIDVEWGDKMNDNDSHKLYFLNIHTNKMESTEVEDVITFTYKIADTRADQYDELNRRIASRRGLSRNMTGKVKDDIIYSTAPVYMIRLTESLQLGKTYADLTKMVGDVGLSVIKNKWLDIITKSRDTALETLSIEREEAIKEGDDLTLEEINVISEMLNGVVDETRDILAQYKDAEQIISYWPPLLLPAPSFVLPPDLYHRYLTKNDK